MTKLSYLNPIRQVNVTLLQETKKPISSLKNLRPLILSNVDRKIVSTATSKQTEKTIRLDYDKAPTREPAYHVLTMWCQRVL